MYGYCYLSSSNSILSNDLLISGLLGLTFSFLIIYFTPKNNQLASLTQNDIEKIKKSPHLKKFFGLNDKDLEIINNKDEIINENINKDEDETSLLYVIIGFFIVLLFISLIFFSLNIFSKGSIGRFLCYLLPREMKTLGLLDYLQNWKA